MVIQLFLGEDKTKARKITNRREFQGNITETIKFVRIFLCLSSDGGSSAQNITALL